MKKIILLLFLISCGHVTKRDSAGVEIKRKQVVKKEVTLKTLDAGLIRKIVVDNLPKIRICYDRQIKRSGKTFKGMANLKFTIKESGVVNKASVTSQDPTFPRPIANCVSSALKTIRFPKSQSGVIEVSQPFNFHPPKS